MLILFIAVFPCMVGIFCAVIWRSFPKVTDKLFIRDELRILVIVCALYAALWSATLVLTAGLKYGSGIALFLISTMVMLVILLMVHILYPQRKLRKINSIDIGALRGGSNRAVHVASTSTGEFKQWESISSVLNQYVLSLIVHFTVGFN